MQNGLSAGVGVWCDVWTKFVQLASIKYSPYRYTTANDDFRTPRVGLAHELKHALDTDNDSVDQTLIQGVPFSEIVAIRVENLIRKVLNEPMRTTYKGKKIDEKYLK